MDNAFDQLCELASRNNWCWKVPCSTCANYDFRYAFLQLADNKKPSDSNWMTTSIIEKENIYTFPHEYTRSIKKSVLRICLQSNLKIISERCALPDWLGYIGVVLAHMEPEYNENRDLYNQVSINWGNQLQNMVPKTSRLYGKTNLGLNFDTLESYERALNGKELISKMELKKANLIYQCLLGIVEDRDKYSYVRIDMYGKISDIDLLSEEEQSILWEKLKEYDKETPFGKFREKYMCNK